MTSPPAPAPDFGPLGRPLKAWVAAPGRHLFAWLRDPRFKLYPEDWTGDLHPDLVIFPCEQPAELAVVDPRLPEGVGARVASGRARIVFDASGEAKDPTPELIEAVHGFLDRLGAPIGRGVYITQHRRFEPAYLARCAAAGVRRPMQVLTYDYWIKRLVRRYEKAGPEVFERRLELFRARPRVRSRRFLSLNRSPRPTKALFLARLMRDGLWDRGHVSFGGLQQLQTMGAGPERLRRGLRRLDGFGDLYADLGAWLDRLGGQPPLAFDAPAPDPVNKATDRVTGDTELAEYGDSWFSVVTETEMAEVPVRVTEKVFKPLLNFHPLLVLGNPGSLAVLRDLGFRTFPELFDEAYDDIAEPRRRFELVYGQLVRLCRMEEPELARLDAAITPTLEHNARVALCELPGLYRTRMDRALIDALVASASKPARPPARG